MNNSNPPPPGPDQPPPPAVPAQSPSSAVTAQGAIAPAAQVATASTGTSTADPVKACREKWEYRLKWAQVIIAFAALVGGVSSLIFAGCQFRLAGQALASSTQQSMTKAVMDLNRVFMDKPELADYFLRKVPVSDSDANYVRVEEVAMMKLTVMDLASTQTEQFRSVWKNPEGWDRWIKDSLVESLLLRTTLSTNLSWYPGLSNYLVDAEAELKKKSSKAQK